MRTIAHVINPVVAHPASDLFAAQPITFESMRVAEAIARTHVRVFLQCVVFPEDRAAVPDDFQLAGTLVRSILDLGAFERPRKLPLLGDILECASSASDAEYLIYTNVDIALMPHFYLAVDRLLAVEADALVINRRTIPDHWSHPSELPLMYSEIGDAHDGFDCFVLPRDLVPKIRLGTVCVGAPFVGNLLLANLMCQVKRFKLLADSHLTFHIGDRRGWQDQRFHDYAARNRAEFVRIMAELEAEFGRFDRSQRPGSSLATGSWTGRLRRRLRKALRR
jgi:hypothetical protein